MNAEEYNRSYSACRILIWRSRRKLEREREREDDGRTVLYTAFFFFRYN